MPTNYWLKFGNTPLGYNGSGVQFTHVEQPGQLVISLNGIGTGFDTTKNFNVLVTFGSAISYTVNGTPVSSPSSTYTATLKKSQSVVLGAIPTGTTFSVTEVALSATDNNSGYANGTVSNGSGTMTSGGNYTATASYSYEANTAVIGGTRYKVTRLSSDGKIWLAENLDLKFSGLSVGSSTVVTSSSKLAWYPQNDEATYGRSGKKYGLIYNQAAANYIQSNRATLIPGWHIPSRSEWQRGPLAFPSGGAAYKSTTGWTTNNGTNSTGFNAYPAGSRYIREFRNLGSSARFYASETNYAVVISSDNSITESQQSTVYYTSSIRLIKDT